MESQFIGGVVWTGGPGEAGAGQPSMRRLDSGLGPFGRSRTFADRDGRKDSFKIEPGERVGGIGRELAVHGWEGAEKKIADVSEHSAATRRDAAFREKKEEAGEKVVNFLGGFEFGSVAGEHGAEVVGVKALEKIAGMSEAETGAGIHRMETAALTGRGAMLATSGIIDTKRVNGQRVHD
jgi:hypothetical protein